MILTFGSDIIWKPPESVKVGPSNPMNFASPPDAATRSDPGWRIRWYVLARMDWPPRSEIWLIVMAFTAAFVPATIKAGVLISPCGV